jgi:hypothetical protein
VAGPAARIPAQAGMPPTARFPAPRGERLGLPVLTAGPVGATSMGPTHQSGGRGPSSLNARGSSPLPSARTQQRDGKA